MTLIVGSLRKESYNRRVAEFIKEKYGSKEIYSLNEKIK
ncbi:MAG: hypothetical protein ACTHW2_11085 [Tissierella sp.]